MGVQLSLKAALPLAGILATASDRCSKTGPSDATWRHWPGSTLAQVMACCLTAPSTYLNQCGLIISGVQWGSSDSQVQIQVFYSRMRQPQPSMNIFSLKMTCLKFLPNHPGANELNYWNSFEDLLFTTGNHIRYPVILFVSEIRWELHISDTNYWYGAIT